MSLYVGKLPPHIRGEELERSFRRFGRCNLQLKDGYGFIVYEVTADAENAMRALRGKIICGERLTLHWSKKQPRPFQRSARGYNVYDPPFRRNKYEPHHGRSPRGVGNGFRFRNFHARKDFAGASCVPTSSRVEDHLDDVFDNETCQDSEDASDSVKAKRSSAKDKVIGEGVASDASPVENDRWGEPASDALTGRGQEDDSVFHRYEPYRGYNRRDDKEHFQRSSPYGSREKGNSPEKWHRECSFDGIEKNTYTSKPYETSFNCGLSGRIMHNCPDGDARREKCSKFNPRRNEIDYKGKGEERAKRSRPRSWVKPNTSRDALERKHHKWDKNGSHSERDSRVERNKTPKKIHSKSRAYYQGKGKRKLENGTQQIRHKKREARSSTSSPSLDSSTANSQSRSKSSRSFSASSSRARSRSISSRSRSPSSSFMSSSSSSYQKSQSSRSRSKSRLRSKSRSRSKSGLRSKSRSRSSSRSSFTRSPSLSVQLDPKSRPFPKSVPTNVCCSMSPKSKLEHVPSPDSEPLLAKETSNPNNTCSPVKDAKVPTQFKADGETNREQPGIDHDDRLLSTYKVPDMENYAFVDTHMDHDINTEKRAVVDIISENLGENSELQEDAGSKLNKEVLPRCEASCSTSISTQEMLLALKHYGLATPQEGESGISVEAYFGAARMWPWQIIYYRRLKKGPISTENYARRLEQNREFGIVDKYIRSSSGWEECQ